MRHTACVPPEAPQSCAEWLSALGGVLDEQQLAGVTRAWLRGAICMPDVARLCWLLASRAHTGRDSALAASAQPGVAASGPGTSHSAARTRTGDGTAAPQAAQGNDACALLWEVLNAAVDSPSCATAMRQWLHSDASIPHAAQHAGLRPEVPQLPLEHDHGPPLAGNPAASTMPGMHSSAFAHLAGAPAAHIAAPAPPPAPSAPPPSCGTSWTPEAIWNARPRPVSCTQWQSVLSLSLGAEALEDTVRRWARGEQTVAQVALRLKQAASPAADSCKVGAPQRPRRLAEAGLTVYAVQMPEAVTRRARQVRERWR